MITPSSVPELLRAPIPDAPVGKQPVRLLVCGIPKGVESKSFGFIYLVSLKSVSGVRRCHHPFRVR